MQKLNEYLPNMYIKPTEVRMRPITKSTTYSHAKERMNSRKMEKMKQEKEGAHEGEMKKLCWEKHSLGWHVETSCKSPFSHIKNMLNKQ